MLTLCHIDDIPEDSSKGFNADGTAVFAVKKNGVVHVYVNQCPHLGVQLEWVEDQFLDIEKSLIQCSTHGALFVIETGQCVSGPCLGEHLHKIEYQLINGLISLDLSKPNC